MPTQPSYQRPGVPWGRLLLIAAVIGVVASLVWLPAIAGQALTPDDSALAPADPLPYTGTFDLWQEDQVCRLSASPHTFGTFDITLDFDAGAASGTFVGGGSGRRDNLRCGNATGDLVWKQSYSGTFSGSLNPANGQIQTTGTIAGTDDSHWENCEENGEPVTCPPWRRLQLPYRRDGHGTRRSGQGGWRHERARHCLAYLGRMAYDRDSPYSNAQPHTDAHPDPYKNSHSDSDGDADSYVYPYAYDDRYSHCHTEPYTHRNTHTFPYIHRHTHPYTDGDVYCYAHPYATTMPEPHVLLILDQGYVNGMASTVWK